MLRELETYRVEWDELESAHRQNAQFLEALAADKSAMRSLIERVPHDPELREMCEHNRTLDKLVLHDAPDRGFRIRVHLWSDTEFGHPHNHRWSFTTRLLTGCYEHVIYEAPGGFNAPEPGSPDQTIELAERFRTVERAGDSYTMHHGMVHCTTTTPRTITMMVRGPIGQSLSLTTDPATGKFWFGVGRQKQTSQEVARRRLTDEQYENFCNEVDKLGIV
jgi:hypothetical protein